MMPRCEFVPDWVERDNELRHARSRADASGSGGGQQDSAATARIPSRSAPCLTGTTARALRTQQIAAAIALPILTRVPGSLFVVATPIGNLEDITLRALRVLREVNLIAAENTRTAARLLRHYEIGTPTTPYNDRNRARTSAVLLARLERGDDIALISDAGTPGVSDPGRELVAAAVRAGLTVTPIPGPAAPLTLWSAAGVRGADLRLRGFLPRRASARRRALLEIGAAGVPTTVFESPHRVAATLCEISDLLPDVELVIGRELTKLHEQIWRGTPAEAVEAFAEPRGEFTILIIPAEPEAPVWSDAAVSDALSEAADAGASRADAARSVAAQAGRPRREVYALWPR